MPINASWAKHVFSQGLKIANTHLINLKGSYIIIDDTSCLGLLGENNVEKTRSSSEERQRGN